MRFLSSGAVFSDFDRCLKGAGLRFVNYMIEFIISSISFVIFKRIKFILFKHVFKIETKISTPIKIIMGNLTN